MNFLEGTVEAVDADGAAIRLKDGSLLQAAVDATGTAQGETVTLGIRPEALQQAGTGLAASVILIESLGNIRFAYLANAASDEPLIVQLAPGQSLAEETAVTLSAVPGACHLFRADGTAFPRHAAGQGSIAA